MILFFSTTGHCWTVYLSAGGFVDDGEVSDEKNAKTGNHWLQGQTAIGANFNMDFSPIGVVYATVGFQASYASSSMDFDYLPPGAAEADRIELSAFSSETRKNYTMYGLRIRFPDMDWLFNAFVGGGGITGKLRLRVSRSEYREKADQPDYPFANPLNIDMSGYYGEAGLELVLKFVGWRLYAQGYRKTSDPIPFFRDSRVTLEGTLFKTEFFVRI